jgi:signal transduction histidine kinase
MAGEDAHHSDADIRIPIDAVPQPLACFAVREDEVALIDTNAQFSAAFRAADAGISFETWWDKHGFTALSRSVTELRAALVAGESVDVAVTVSPTPDGDKTPDGRTYRLKSQETGDTVQTLVLLHAPVQDDAFTSEEIASVVSHDLRNPLDVAKAHLRAARETGESEHFDSLEQAHDRMERIIQDVLTLARRDGALSLTPDTEVETVAQEAWTTVDTTRVSLRLASELPAIEADPDRLQRLFENLFRNVVEHSSTDSQGQAVRGKADERGELSNAEWGESRTEANDERAGKSSDTSPDDDSPDASEGARDGARGHEKTVTIRVGVTEGGFYVADDGPGIPEADREQVFEPGYSDGDGGTGLGLQIVEQIALAHGWRIALRESERGGARFEFRGVVPCSE